MRHKKQQEMIGRVPRIYESSDEPVQPVCTENNTQKEETPLHYYFLVLKVDKDNIKRAQLLFGC